MILNYFILIVFYSVFSDTYTHLTVGYFNSREKSRQLNTNQIFDRFYYYYFFLFFLARIIIIFTAGIFIEYFWV